MVLPHILIFKKLTYIAFAICFLFFVAYMVLSTIRHAHYQSFGFDLGVVDQVVWKYSTLQWPITTVHHFAFTSLLTDHVEFIFILLAPFYWIYNSAYTLLVLQALFVAFSGIPIFLLARRYKLNPILSLVILVSYLSFYGIQNALWFDVHSLSFAASFLAWFIYFLDNNNTRLTVVTFFLAVICKEDISLLTFLICFVYFVTTKKKIALLLMLLSALYLFFVFFVYFPHFTQDGYRYANKGGLFSDLNPSYLFDTDTKKQIIFYSFAWFGFLPLLSPLHLLPAFGDISHYFVFGHSVPTAQEFFMHYRIALAPLLVLPTIVTLKKYKKLNTPLGAIGLLIWVFGLQYSLHAPLSYLVKQWFWTEPKSVKDINAVIAFIPQDASVVSQNNITPHVTHRDNIFTFWPEKSSSMHGKPCGKKVCHFFRWDGNPTYLIVDTSKDWDIRHFLADRNDYIEGIGNLEKYGYVKVYKKQGNAALYKILKHP